MKYHTINGIDTQTNKEILDDLKEFRLIIIKNNHTIPEKELVNFYYSLGDCVVHDKNYMSDVYVEQYTNGFRELIAVRNKFISGYGEPGLFAGNDEGEVAWHSEPQNRDTYEDIIALTIKNLPDTGGETFFIDQQEVYNDFTDGFKLLIDDLEIDWSHRFSKRETIVNFQTDEDIPYNPWQKWDSKCYKGGDGWNYLNLKDIDGK